MNTTVAMRADFDPTFPDLRGLPKDADRVPGRPLGELIVQGLRERGFETSDLQNEEPFFVTRCKSGDYTYPVMACFAFSDEVGSAWMVSCDPVLGFWARLYGKSEEKELGMLLEAIDDTLRKETRVSDLRWFTEAPYDPFSEARYARSPRGET